MLSNGRHRSESTHPDDFGSADLCAGCPACDVLARQRILSLEIDMERVSLELWALGWRPSELMEAVRRTTGLADATGLVAHVVLADDVRRSEQARPAAWVTEIEQLRIRTGILRRKQMTNRSAGSVGGSSANSSEHRASQCLAAVLDALFDLVDERAVA